MTDYHPVTKEELEQIKIRCKYPERNDCGGCEHFGYDDETFEKCTFNRNALMDEVLSRPDPLALLEAWRAYMEYTLPSVVWDAETEFIKQLRTNPSAMREQGIKEGWWHD